jgi:pSer/pThr/pTyr-binding forkhead associated (FHA) protein
MEPVKLKVKCPRCQEANILTVPENMMGKESLRKCLHCEQMFPFTAPTAEKLQQIIQSQKGAQAAPKPAQAAPPPADEGFKTTINRHLSNNEKVLYLECLPNEFTKGQRFEVRQSYMTIGRLSTLQGSYRPDIAIETTDNYMHRKNSILKRHNNFFSIENAPESVNGTYLNEIRLDPLDELILKEGDVVRIGKTSIRVSIR